MVRYLMMLACMYLVIMQDACAMETKGVVKCPAPTKPVTLIAWLFSWGQQEANQVDKDGQNARPQNVTLDKLVAIPGRVEMPDESKQGKQKTEEDNNRPPTPFYAYPGGPMLPSPDPEETTERCRLKISSELWFPCGK
jgi:hypothetical protein